MKAWTIHRAVEKRKKELVGQLLDSDPTLVAARDSNSDQPLHLAAWQNYPDIAKLLIDKGADVNATGDLGRTPLHYASLHSSPQAAAILLANNANPDLLDDFDCSPLHLTALKQNLEGSAMFGLLLQAGASLDLRTAVLLSMTKVVRSFLKEDPQLVRSIANPGILVLDAVEGQRAELVELLLAHGFPPNAFSDDCSFHAPSLFGRKIQELRLSNCPPPLDAPAPICLFDIRSRERRHWAKLCRWDSLRPLRYCGRQEQVNDQ